MKHQELNKKRLVFVEFKMLLPFVEENFNIYGYQGLMDLLQIGKTTAYKLLSSGVLDAAVIKRGKIIIIDSDLALDLLKTSRKKHGKR